MFKLFVEYGFKIFKLFSDRPGLWSGISLALSWNGVLQSWMGHCCGFEEAVNNSSRDVNSCWYFKCMFKKCKTILFLFVWNIDTYLCFQRYYLNILRVKNVFPVTIMYIFFYIYGRGYCYTLLNTYLKKVFEGFMHHRAERLY